MNMGETRKYMSQIYDKIIINELKKFGYKPMCGLYGNNPKGILIWDGYWREINYFNRKDVINLGDNLFEFLSIAKQEIEKINIENNGK